MSRMRLMMTLVALALAGCGITNPISNYQPSPGNVALVRAAPLAAIAVGDFSLALGVKPNADAVIVLRGAVYASPVNNSFAQFLRQAIVTELTSAQKYAPDAPTVLTGQLLHNDGTGFGISTAHAAIAARFQVRRGEELLFDKELSADAVWKSSFAADIAVVEATSQYLNLYGRLLAKLFADPEFQHACASRDAG
jgi:hypothetical protein